jgi:hypothetical protein
MPAQWAWGGAVAEALGLPALIRHVNQRMASLESWTRSPYITGAAQFASCVALRVSADRGNANVTVDPMADAPIQRFNTPLTAARTVTLATVGVPSGAWVRVVREAGATGAFNLNVGPGPLKALTAASTWCDVVYDGTAWRLVAHGSL